MPAAPAVSPTFSRRAVSGLVSTMGTGAQKGERGRRRPALFYPDHPVLHDTRDAVGGLR